MASVTTAEAADSTTALVSSPAAAPVRTASTDGVARTGINSGLVLGIAIAVAPAGGHL